VCVCVCGGRRGSLKERANRDECSRDTVGLKRRLQAGIKRGEVRTHKVNPFQGPLDGVDSWYETVFVVSSQE
jgi:hypothetical protein